MSHTLTPKNYNRTSAVVTTGVPDYIITSADAFPTPPVEAGNKAVGMRLIVSDLGDEYEWTGTYWLSRSKEGVINVHSGPQIRDIVGSQVYLQTPILVTTLTAAANSQDRDIVVASTAGVLVGHKAALGVLGSTQRVPLTIVNIVGNTLTLSVPLDLSYASGSTVVILSAALNVAGTAANPVVFVAAPPANATWHISRLTLNIVHGTAGDMGLFGDLAPLTYGVALRLLIGGVYYTYTAWRTNGDIATDMYDLRFDTRSSGGGSYGTTARLDIRDSDTVIELNGDTNDSFQILVQDDLSSLDDFQIRLLGHVATSDLVPGT